MDYFKTLAATLNDLADMLEGAPGPATREYLRCRLRRKAAEINVLGTANINLDTDLRYQMSAVECQCLQEEISLLRAAMSEGYVIPNLPVSDADPSSN